MASVADGEMSDEKLKDMVVDKDGYASANSKLSPDYPKYAFSLFFRRECLIQIRNVKILVPRELPVGVQLRVSAIILFHIIWWSHSDVFFDSVATTPIGMYDEIECLRL